MGITNVPQQRVCGDINGGKYSLSSSWMTSASITLIKYMQNISSQHSAVTTTSKPIGQAPSSLEWISCGTTPHVLVKQQSQRCEPVTGIPLQQNLCTPHIFIEKSSTVLRNSTLPPTSTQPLHSMQQESNGVKASSARSFSMPELWTTNSS